jgi:hypothetical protein
MVIFGYYSIESTYSYFSDFSVYSALEKSFDSNRTQVGLGKKPKVAELKAILTLKNAIKKMKNATNMKELHRVDLSYTQAFHIIHNILGIIRVQVIFCSSHINSARKVETLAHLHRVKNTLT